MRAARVLGAAVGWLRLRTRESLRAAGVLSAAMWLAETQDTCGMCMLDWIAAVTVRA